MNKFVGTWNYQSSSLDTSRSNSGESVLQLKFTRSQSCKKVQNITEYLVGSAFPNPSEDQLVNPLLHGGVYEWIHVDGVKQHIRCGTDYFGLGRVYYTSTENAVLFSNDIFLLIKEARLNNLSMLACSMLLALGECIGRHTLVENVFRLEHGEVLECDKYNYRIKKKWELLPAETTIQPSRFIADNNELLLEVLRNSSNWPGQRVCLLSGGDDSRRIAAGLDFVGVDTHFVTQRYIGPGGFDEDTIPAKRVAKCLRSPLTVVNKCSAIEIGEDTITTLMEANCESLLHGWLQQTLRHISPGSLVYDGLGGGELMNGHYVRKYPQCAEQYHRSDLLAETLLNNQKISIRSALKDELTDAILGCINKIPESPYRMTLFHLYNHTRRNTGSVAALMRERGLSPYMPFVVKELAESALSLDHKEHFKNLYQGLATNAINPTLATIPSTRSSFPNEFKIDLRHLIQADNNALASIGKTDFILFAGLISTKSNLLMLLSEVFRLHEKHLWRSVPLRKLGFLASVLKNREDDEKHTQPAFIVSKAHRV